MSNKQITPWGSWEVLLEEPLCKVKKIVVHPGQRLSYQKHFKREERWVIVQGTATVTLDGVDQKYTPGEVVIIPPQAAHRMANLESGPDVIFIETQLGTYFGEDDIIRLEDDYGRA